MLAFRQASFDDSPETAPLSGFARALAEVERALNPTPKGTEAAAPQLGSLWRALCINHDDLIIILVIVPVSDIDLLHYVNGSERRKSKSEVRIRGLDRSNYVYVQRLK